jgi:hypothetical protein
MDLAKRLFDDPRQRGARRLGRLNGAGRHLHGQSNTESASDNSEHGAKGIEQPQDGAERIQRTKGDNE